MHLDRGVARQDVGNLVANMNGRAGLSPLVMGATVHGKPGFLIDLLDLIAGSQRIRTTSRRFKIDEENYGQIGGVIAGRNDFEVSFVNLGAKPTIASVQLLPGTGVYVTSHKPKTSVVFAGLIDAR
jgi:hypothetical protein